MSIIDSLHSLCSCLLRLFFIDRILKKYRIVSENRWIRPISAEYDRIILEYIEKNGKITRKEAKGILDWGETKIKELFNELIDRGLIERLGRGRSTYYILRDK